MNYLNNRKNAFSYAFSGLWQVVKKEAHMKIHLCAAIAAISAGIYFKISAAEWMVIAFCIVFVFCLEIINTALERICDMVMPDQHPSIKYIKDISAAAVLLACIFAVLGGLVIFLPHIF